MEDDPVYSELSIPEAKLKEAAEIIKALANDVIYGVTHITDPKRIISRTQKHIEKAKKMGIVENDWKINE
jgi:hypothetical protein